MTFLLETMRLGLANLRLHLLRSFLTALGIILGVAAVITMVSLGEGSKQEALRQIEQLGARNIILRSKKPAESTQQQAQGRSLLTKYGVTRDDLAVIQENFPDAEAIVPLKAVGSQLLRKEHRQVSQTFGTIPDLAKVANLRVRAGGRYLTRQDLDERSMVAVIGHEVSRELFPWDDPIGNTLRIDDKAFTVVGVLMPVGLSGGAGTALVGRDLNKDVHIPLSTARAVFSDAVFRRVAGSFTAEEVQISEMYMSVRDRGRVLTDAARLERIMEARRVNVPTDWEMVVPFELLAQAKKTALTFTVVFSFVAGISLLVGGIGIMNIMLATVTERTREIGIRRALGATRRHVIWQFLVETGVLSAMGGLMGVGLGILASWLLGWGVPLLPKAPLIGRYFPSNISLPTQVTLWSIVLAFIVAAATGLIFGIYPARKAAQQDPIEALRHD